MINIEAIVAKFDIKPVRFPHDRKSIMRTAHMEARALMRDNLRLGGTLTYADAFKEGLRYSWRRANERM